MSTKKGIAIGITGMAGAGKNEVVSLILEKRTCQVIVFREIVEAELRKRGMPINNRTLREFATEMRETFGRDVIARRCLPLVKRALENNDIVILNTIKATEEVDLLRKELRCPVILVAVHAGPKTRFKRLSQRGLAWDMNDWESFRWRDKVELGWGVGEAIALADYMIVNEGTLEDLKNDVDCLWSHIQKVISESEASP